IRDLIVTGVQTCALPIFVDDDALEVTQCLARDRADRVLDIVTAVVARDDDGDAGQCGFAHDFAGPRKSKSTPWSACSTSLWNRQIGRASCRERGYVSVVA